MLIELKSTRTYPRPSIVKTRAKPIAIFTSQREAASRVEEGAAPKTPEKPNLLPRRSSSKRFSLRPIRLIEPLALIEECTIDDNIAKQTGMARNDLNMFSRIYRNLNKVGIYRVINPDAAPSLEGGAAGKSMKTKAKSSNFRHTASDILYDVSLSKVSESYLETLQSLLTSLNELFPQNFSINLTTKFSNTTKSLLNAKVKQIKMLVGLVRSNPSLVDESFNRKLFLIIDEVKIHDHKKLEQFSQLKELLGDIARVNSENDKIFHKNQKKNDENILKSEQEYKEIRRQGIGNKAKVELLNNACLHIKYPKKVKIGNAEYPLMVIKTKSGASYRTSYDFEKSAPRFAVIINGCNYRCDCNNIDGKYIFDRGEQFSLKSHEKLTTVDLLGYRQFVLDENTNQIKEIKPLKIAPDYDELTSSVAEIFPLELAKYKEKTGYAVVEERELNDEFVMQIDTDLLVNLGLFQEDTDNSNPISNIIVKIDRAGISLIQSVEFNGKTIQIPQEQVEDFIINLCLADKLQKQRDVFTAQKKREEMGIITEVKEMQKMQELHDLPSANATSHAAEDSNLNPEPFVKGNYATILNDKSAIILHNEVEICQFINEKRKQGFPLEVNPRWFWLTDQDGNLFVPQDKFPHWEEFVEIRAKFGESKNTTNSTSGMTRSNTERSGSFKLGSSSLQPQQSSLDLEKQMFGLFSEYLHLSTAPRLCYSDNGFGDQFADLKKAASDKYDQWKEQRLVELREKIANLNRDLFLKTSRNSTVFQLTQNFFSWSEQQKQPQLNSPNLPNSSTSPVTARSANANDMHQLVNE